jgi:hypothetical protein
MKKTAHWDLHNLYSSPDISRPIKLKRRSWAGHVARMGEERKLYKVWVGKPEGNRHSEDRGVDGRMGLKWTLGDWLGGGCGVYSPCSG